MARKIAITNQVALVDTSATTLTVTGAENLGVTSTSTGTSALSRVDASATTGNVNLSGLVTAAAVTETAGTSNDVLHASAGLSTLNGGSGADTFGFSTVERSIGRRVLPEDNQ